MKTRCTRLAVLLALLLGSPLVALAPLHCAETDPCPAMVESPARHCENGETLRDAACCPSLAGVEPAVATGKVSISIVKVVLRPDHETAVGEGSAHRRVPERPRRAGESPPLYEAYSVLLI